MCPFQKQTAITTGIYEFILDYNQDKFKKMSVMSAQGASKKMSARQKESAVLEREDFDAGPTNLDCIEPGLWLVTDTPREDLLSHFEDTADFINSGQEQGVVLVHCYFGVSRSATIVIAYMMKKYELTYEEAFERVKSKRRFVGPNPGFISQLQLYEVMNWQVDKSNIQFRMYRLQIAADQVKKAKILPQSCMDVVKSDPSLITVKPDPLVYRCRKCRQEMDNAGKRNFDTVFRNILCRTSCMDAVHHPDSSRKNSLPKMQDKAGILQLDNGLSVSMRLKNLTCILFGSLKS
ncbi:hypothetical protein C0J52_24114 [Blattella germanica]|nr:hypothetical protein C0J52_24114 [Blattella germanica]